MSRVVVLLIVVICAGAVARRPRRFWPLLAGGTLVTSGFMFNGHAVVDELVAAGVLVGALLAVSVRGIPPRKSGDVTGLHAQVFLLLLLYLMLETIRSTIIQPEWSLVRWAGFHLALAVALLLHWRWSFPVPDDRKIAITIAVSSLLYFAVYITHGMLTEAVRGISRWDVQGLEWAGSAYAFFPVTVMTPAAIFLLQDRQRVYRVTGSLAILTSLVGALYYDSRVALLVLLAFLSLAPLAVGFRKVVGLGVVAGAILIFAVWSTNVPLGEYVSGLLDTLRASYAPRESDLDRHLHLVASVSVVIEDWRILAFGAGINLHRQILVPYITDLYYRFLPGLQLPEIMRTTGFPAVLIDTGIIGLGLLCAVFVLTARSILHPSRSNRRPIVFLSLVVTFMWFLVSDIRDIVLVYLVVMPSGLLTQLAHRDFRRPGNSPIHSWPICRTAR